MTVKEYEVTSIISTVELIEAKSKEDALRIAKERTIDEYGVEPTSQEVRM